MMFDKHSRRMMFFMYEESGQHMELGDEWR